MASEIGQHSQNSHKRGVFNPFIVLSDITISTIVLLACILMVFAACIGATTWLGRRQKVWAEAVARKQEALYQHSVKDLPKDLPIYHARGLQTYLMRFADSELFQKSNPAKLTSRGKRTFRNWAESFGPELRRMAGPPGNPPDYPLVEVEVQGHCSPGEDHWHTSLRRASAVVSVFYEVNDFPHYLVSISGYGCHRRVFLVDREEPVPLQDRIDILLTWAGDRNDSTFVCPFDPPDRIYGPLNPHSDPNYGTQ